MPRYVLANRRAGKYTTEEKHASRAAVAMTLTHLEGISRVIHDKNPSDSLARRVVVLDAEIAQIAGMRAALPPDAILEPLVRRSLHRRVPMVMRGAMPMAALAVSGATAYSVTLNGGGQPLAGIQVLFYFQDPSGQIQTTQAPTDDQGQVQVSVPPGWTIAMVEPIPYAGFWIMLVEAPPNGSTIDCLPVAPSPAGGAWWHTVMGVDVNAAGRGAGIKVGVIDTGCGPHPNLQQVNLVGVFVDNQILPGSGATDVAEHGTHTTGLIGARPSQAGDYAGMATACDLYHARVFKSEEEGPSQADLVNAIDALSRDNGCDLINMSLGGGPPSQVEEDCIRDAVQRGTLCICSAGNDAQAINYPGAYPECAAVSAIGQLGWAPPGTFSSANRPQDPSLMGQQNLFLAAFSSFALTPGTELACAGPGVGIVSTVPDHNGATDLYMEMDGTSMASPAVCGVLAVILGADASYMATPRDQSRTAAARNLLAQHCQPFGLAVQYEGRGLPHV